MMKTKILAIEIVIQPGTKKYQVGKEYNGLLLDRIEDKSIEYDDSLTVIYCGSTASGDTIFELINAPVDVQFGPIEEPLEDER